MDSFENVKGTITPVSEKYAHLTYFMVQGTQKRLLCISAEDAADPDKKILPSIVIPVRGRRRPLLYSFPLCLPTIFPFD